MFKTLRWCLVMLCCTQWLQGQTNPNLEAHTRQLEIYNAQFPQEKVYLHTDRKYYAAGEAIWFQSYLTAAYYHEPSPFSNNVYVELYNSSKELIDEKLIRSEKGFGKGVIDLPEDLQAGSYVLRAYTNWMRNFPDAFFFEKELVVINPNNPEATVPAQLEEIDLQFFPEGGDMVAGVPGRVAFKAINSFGESVTVEGQVLDKEGKEVAVLQTQHEGMGFFAFTPKAGNAYEARLSSGATFALPTVKETGFSLTVNNNIQDFMRLTFRSNAATKGKNKMGVIIHTRGAISFVFDVDLSSNMAMKNVPKATIPAGISHVTLFDNKGRPVVERLVYVDKNEGTVSLATDQQQYSPRSRVQAELQVKDAKGAPIKGTFSLSVIDLGQTLDREPENTIYSELQLSSDLKGHVNNPMYYFDKENPMSGKHLDLLLMTHGWRRFSWESLKDKEKSAPQYLIEQGVNIKGNLLSKLGKKSQADGKVTLLNQSTTPPLFVDLTTAADGSFSFQNLELYQNQQLVLQGENRKGKKNVVFTLDTLKDPALFTDFSTTLAPPIFEEALFDQFVEKSKYRNQINEAYDFDTTARLLETVVVEGSRVQREEEIRKSVYGGGDNTYRFPEGRATAANNPLEYLQGKMAGVTIDGFGSDMTVNIRNSAGGGGAIPPLILVDDVPTDVQYVTSIPANLIDRVEVFKGPSAAIFGVRGAGGALAFYTKTGAQLNFRKDPPGVFTFKLQNSYQVTREFYAPKYDIQKPEHIKPDSRVVLHWQPLIEVDENGKAVIEFWNSDLPTEVMLDLQGISFNGIPFHTTATYEITKR